MTNTLSCVEIKQIYDTLYSESTAVYEKLLVVDNKSELESLESLIAVVQRKYFALLSDTENMYFEKEYIFAFNPDIVEAYGKDINGFWEVQKSNGHYILYHPVTKERSEEFEDIRRRDTNGFWSVKNKDGFWILYHPITKERIEEFDPIYQFDTNGFWSVQNENGGYILYHPITKERSEEFKDIDKWDTDGFWHVTTMDGKTMKYNPLTKKYKE
jgi:hypothetical protein